MAEDDILSWEQIVSGIVVDREYDTDKSNKDQERQDLDAALDMLVCERSEKDYEWQSDIFIPDFPSMHWTQIGESATQYFSRWEKVDCPPSTNDPLDVLKSKAAKDVLNFYFNEPYMHYFQKSIRMRSFNRLAGWAILKCWYESDIEVKQAQTGVRRVPRETSVDIYGNPKETSEYPVRMRVENEPVYQDQKIIHMDRPNFDVWPNNDVFMDNEYVYSLQDKNHVTFRSEMKLTDLLESAEANQYFNLDKLENELETDTATEGYNKQNAAGKKYERLIQRFNPNTEILERWGKWPVVLMDYQEAVQLGLPYIEYIPQGLPVPVNGIDENGDLLDGAEMVEMIITVANINKSKIPIRFQVNYPDYGGYGFRPMTRALCYVHPTKDRGIGDGKYARELQIAINDTYNMGNDRTRMATFPTLKQRKYADIDEDTILFGPEQKMMMADLGDIEEFKIEDNIQGALLQQDMLFGKLQQILATYTTDMGGVPRRKEPVTTVVMAEQKSNLRNNLVNLTVEHTGMQEFYTILLRMIGNFMQPETLMEILGESAIFFDPESQYNFVPVSTAVLTEHAKEMKQDKILQLIGYLAGIPQNPRIFMLINLLLSEFMELSGKEFSQYADFLLDPTAPVPELIEMSVRPKNQKSRPQNQYGNEQTPVERRSRNIGTTQGENR